MRELPKDVLKMASGLILLSGLAGHRRQLCNVATSFVNGPLRMKRVEIIQFLGGVCCLYKSELSSA